MSKTKETQETVKRSLADRSAWIAEFFCGLADLEFRSLMTPRMMPALYLLAIIASAWAVITYVIEGFTASYTQGLVRAVLIAPMAFVVLVTLVRVALELCLVIFRIAVHINKMAGHTEEIAGGFPKITFWKSFRRKDE
jgi:hypothetical protein